MPQHMRTAIISGVSGQDGAYLARLLLLHGYQVIGLVRSCEGEGLWRLKYLGIAEKVRLVECDLTDMSQIFRLIQEEKPDEVYHLAAQSSVSVSFSQPIATINYNTISTLNLLETIRLSHASLRFYQASSSEMFGAVNKLPIDENTVINPQSPYAISKATGYWMTRNYREAYKLFATSGILFNHESALRQPNFVVKKIIRTGIDITEGKADKLVLGNIDVRRDFGYAPAYVSPPPSGKSWKQYFLYSGFPWGPCKLNRAFSALPRSMRISVIRIKPGGYSTGVII
jgi:GDPmannose 4,6-dehydratase